MLSKTAAIVIKTTDYSENSVVLKCFTAAYGLQSYLVNGVKNRKGAVRPSQLLPLSLLELEAYHQQNKNLQRIKELRCFPALHELHVDLLKSCLAIFMAELLHKSLLFENQRDEKLFDFLQSSIQFVDLSQGSLALFPSFFMLQLSRYLGFFPKTDYDAGRTSFNLQEANFFAWEPNREGVLTPELSSVLFELSQCNFQNFQQLDSLRGQRNTLLQSLITYFRLHVPGFVELKSHTVLAEVLS